MHTNVNGSCILDLWISTTMLCILVCTDYPPTILLMYCVGVLLLYSSTTTTLVVCIHVVSRCSNKNAVFENYPQTTQEYYFKKSRGDSDLGCRRRRVGQCFHFHGCCPKCQRAAVEPPQREGTCSIGTGGEARKKRGSSEARKKKSKDQKRSKEEKKCIQKRKKRKFLDWRLYSS